MVSQEMTPPVTQSLHEALSPFTPNNQVPVLSDFINTQVEASSWLGGGRVGSQGGCW